LYFNAFFIWIFSVISNPPKVNIIGSLFSAAVNEI